MSVFISSLGSGISTLLLYMDILYVNHVQAADVVGAQSDSLETALFSQGHLKPIQIIHSHT